MESIKLFAGQKQKYLSKVNTKESNPLDSSFPWMELMGFNNKENFQKKAKQLHKFIEHIPSYEQFNNNDEIKKKFISDLNTDPKNKSTLKQLNSIVNDIDRTHEGENIEMFDKLIIYCFLVNYDDKTSYTQGDNFQLYALLTSVQKIFKKKEEYILVTAYLFCEIYKKIIKPLSSPVDLASKNQEFIRWCIFTFTFSKNLKILKKIDDVMIYVFFNYFVNTPNDVLLQTGKSFPLIGKKDSYNENQILRIYGHLLMFEDVISIIAYYITIFVQSNSIDKLITKLKDYNGDNLFSDISVWKATTPEYFEENPTQLGYMGDIFGEEFNYDIYLKIYQFLTKPAENIRFTGDKENRVPYIYNLHKMYTSEILNYKTKGINVYKKINLFNQDDKDEDENEDEDDDGAMVGYDGREHKERDIGVKKHEDDELLLSEDDGDGNDGAQGPTPTPPPAPTPTPPPPPAPTPTPAAAALPPPNYDEDAVVAGLQERLKALSGGTRSKQTKPLHAMNIRELCKLASSYKNVKNTCVKKKEKEKEI